MIKAKEEFQVEKNNIGYVESSFTNEFGEEEVTPGSVLSFQTLKRDMKDSEIISELKIEECTLGDVLKTLQDAPESMKDGYSNIFYIKGHSRIVGVCWSGSRWGVSTWRRGGDVWGSGGRVFSSATTLSPSSTGSSETLTLPNSKYTEMVEWLYLNTGSQMSTDLRKSLIEKLKEVLK